MHVAETDLVALENIRDDSQVAIVGELVSEKLGVDVDAEDIGHEDNSLFGVLILRVGDIGVDWRIAWLTMVLRCFGVAVIGGIEYLTSVDILKLASGSTFVLEARGTAGSGRVGGHFDVRRGI